MKVTELLITTCVVAGLTAALISFGTGAEHDAEALASAVVERQNKIISIYNETYEEEIDKIDANETIEDVRDSILSEQGSAWEELLREPLERNK